MDTALPETVTPEPAPSEEGQEAVHRATAIVVGAVLAICGVAILAAIGLGIAAALGAFG